MLSIDQSEVEEDKEFIIETENINHIIRSNVKCLQFERDFR